MKSLANVFNSIDKPLRIACGIIGVLILLSGYLGYRLYTLTRGSTTEAEQVIADVGKTVDLPKDEIPTVATVSDPSKLKDQPFFAEAQIGDKVLIYAKAKRAILYRPSTHKIIGIAPITGTPPASP